ncbi:MAG: hypothetical protein QI197_00395 [Candidatus Korarchaeota archaeon]|nr:hypothetical protein [Candidatus Korarchaeota archaeon]
MARGVYETNLPLGIKVLEGEQAQITSSAPVTAKTTGAAGPSTTTKSRTGAAKSGYPSRRNNDYRDRRRRVSALLVAIPLFVILALIAIFVLRRLEIHLPFYFSARIISTWTCYG